MRGVIALLVLVLLPFAAFGQDRVLERIDFEDASAGKLPGGWFVPVGGFKGEATDEKPGGGALSLRLKATGGGNFGNLMRSFEPGALAGKYVEITAKVRYAGPPGGRAQMWVRVDRPREQMGLFDNMGDRPVTGPEWTDAKIVGEIAADAASVNIGLMLLGGKGEAGLDEIVIREAPRPAEDGPRALSERACVNLIAFARLYGVVAHFHPSDGAMKTDWDRFVVRGIRATEDAPDDAALEAALRDLFATVAPSVQVWVASGPEPAPAAEPDGATRWFSMIHRGYAGRIGAKPAPGQMQIYGSRVSKVRLPLEPDAEVHGTPPGTSVVLDLTAGLKARVPLGVYADGAGSLPRVEKEKEKEAETPLRPEQRATRLAGVIVLWTTLKHFYPYWDVTKTDWDAALAPALSRAAVDADPALFEDDLAKLLAQIKDGHGRVFSPYSKRAFSLPMQCEIVGESLVVTRVTQAASDAGARPGDTILGIDAKEIGEGIRETSERICAASPGWMRYRLAGELMLRESPAPADVHVQRADGSEAMLTLTPRPLGAIDLAEPRPENGKELAPGVLYFDLNGAKAESLAPLLERMAGAKGVIFDLRGYPDSAGADLLPHLSDVNLKSAQWRVPTITRPGSEGVTYSQSNWDLPPARPRLKGRIVFITDGRAISYAESCMGIVEAYKLGEIVGQPTAGSNGNVVPIALPGGYGAQWTGMQVLKHDGSRHHGVGILPTAPAERSVKGIREGRDELLEKAIEAAAKP